MRPTGKQTIDNPRRTFKSFPATCAPGIGFQNQCAHWWRKQFLQSGSRPKIPQVFGSRSFSSYALKSRPADF
jgi:hypothetical protein